MKIRVKKTWLVAMGLALAMTAAGGVALADGPDDWYEGDNATVADHDNTGVALKLYNASGTEVTSGSTTAPLAAFAAAAGAVRSGDTFASLYVHLPQSSTAPGAWPGVQVTGTDRFSGSGAVSAPGSLSGKPYVTTTADGYSLADVAAILPNTESADSFAGVYELRLRTSSPTDGVSAEYAAAYVKISGSTWQVTDAPILGEGGGTATSVTVGWPAKVTYGKAAKVTVSVEAKSGGETPTGTVRVVSGSTTVGTATLSGGSATVTLSKSALEAGSQSLRVRYDGAAGAFGPSQSSTKAIQVAKGTPGKPTLKVAGKTGTVTVPTAGGLAKATGKATVTLTKGATKKVLTVKIKAGKGTVTLPAGSWSATVVYAGDKRYVSVTSKTVKVTVTG